MRGKQLTTLRYSPVLIAMLLAARLADANDLKDLYELALTRDASLQARCRCYAGRLLLSLS